MVGTERSNMKSLGLLFALLVIPLSASGEPIPRVTKEVLKAIQGPNITVVGCIEDMRPTLGGDELELEVRVTSRVRPQGTEIAPGEFFDVRKGIILIRTSQKEFGYSEEHWQDFYKKIYLFVLHLQGSGVYQIVYSQKLNYGVKGNSEFLQQLREDIFKAPLK